VSACVSLRLRVTGVSGNVVYHQIHHSEPVRSNHTGCVCSTNSGYFRAQLNAFVTQAQLVYCAVRTGPLKIIRFNPGIYRVKKQERAFLSGECVSS